MSDHLLTSVVIPAFNAEDYLDRTLGSVLAQTHRNLEVIVVDDGSSDSTNLIATQFAATDNRVRVIRTSNGGVAEARNTGVEAATGEYVAFLDADDLWHPCKVQNQIEALTTGQGREAAAAYTRMRIIDWEDRVIRNGSATGQSGYLLARHMFARPVGNGSSLLVRREVALEFGGFDSSWRAQGIGGCEDLDLELKIAAKYPLIGLGRYLVGYRSHAGNMSSSNFTLAMSVIATVNKHLDLHPQLPRWAIQKIRAATLEYALQNIAASGQWTVFLAKLAGLYRIDLGRGLEYTGRFAARKVLRDLLALKRRVREPRERPLFYELDPDLCENFRVSSYRTRDLKVLDRMALLDTQLRVHYLKDQQDSIRVSVRSDADTGTHLR